MRPPTSTDLLPFLEAQLNPQQFRIGTFVNHVFHIESPFARDRHPQITWTPGTG